MTAARNLLTYAFGAEIIDRIPSPSLVGCNSTPRCWRERTGAPGDRHERTPIRQLLPLDPGAFDVERIRADFPILRNVHPHGKPLVYLDNAASSQMPQQVIDRLVRYQTTQHANIHRGVHYLSETATAEYEGARARSQRFINAREERE